MNPLLDILAAHPTAGNPAAGGIPVSPEGASEGIFGMVLAAAVQQAQTPPLAESLMSLPTMDRATAAPNPGASNTESTAVLPYQQFDLPEVPPSLNEATMPTENVIDIAGKTVSLVPLLELAEIAQSNAGITDPVLPNSETRLTQTVAAWIEQTSPKQPMTSSPLIVPSTVTIDAAESISNDEVVAILAQASPVSNNESKPTARLLDSKQLPQDQRAANFKLTSLLQREFPKLNIESVSAKNEYQIRLTPTVQAHDQAQPLVAAAQITPSAELPITPTHRPVKPLMVAPAPGSQKAVAFVAAPDATPENSFEVPTATANEPKPIAATQKTVNLRTVAPIIEDAVSANTTGNSLGEFDSAFKSASSGSTDSSPVSEATYAKTTDLERAHFTVKRVQIDTLLKRGEIKLQLQPEHLGTVKIRLVTTPHETVARLETSSEDARRAVEVSLPQLRESFERAGLKLNQIEVVVGDDSLSRHSHLFQRHPKQPRRPMPVAPVAELASLTSAAANTGSVGLLSGLNLLA